MAELSKISGVAIADVAAVDAVLKANIASILGLTLPSGAAFLLDTYTGAAAAYSVRRLNSSYTGACMRVREDSGDTETDIGFDANGDLDTAAIATHCGANNGFVVYWYDQSTAGGTGSGNDLQQATFANQPQIYDGAAVITENGEPALQYDGTDDAFTDVTLSSAVNQNNMASFGVGRWAAASPAYPLISNLHTSTDDAFGLAYRGDQYLYNDTTFGTHGANDFTQRLWSGYADNASSDVKFYRDGVQQASTTPVSDTHSNFHVGGVGHTAASTRWNGYVQEILLFGVSTKSDHSAIETDINSEYLIYQPTDTPTSGLLATYSGAAAAYSVRQLADTAVISMTVRRDSDDEEQRFGFDENGDLDTAGIAAFCGSANGYVSQWWDQSTNGNHASQGTASQQPQIYNGTAVITENGKPCIDYDSTGGDSFNMVTSIDVVTSIHVLKGESGTGFEQYILGGSSSLDWYSSNGQFVNQNSEAGQNTTLHLDGASVNPYIARPTTQSLAFFNWTTGSGTTNQITQDRGSSARSWKGTYQELILYTTDESSNRTGIETDINSYFSIY